MTVYNNLPNKEATDSLQKVVKYFDGYYKIPVDLDEESIDQLQGFFESKGFDKTAAKNVTYVILKTAKESNYKVQEIIDSLSGYSPIQLNDFLISILNFNRVKTSSLGILSKVATADQVNRNIKA
jgi:hypothetical protein